MPAVLGFAWVWLWQRTFHLPEHHPSIAAAERELILGGRGPASPVGSGWRDSLRRFRHSLRYRETWGLLLARLSADGACYFFAFWIPNYLADECGFALRDIAWAAAVLFMGLGVMAIQVKQASLFALPADLFPSRDVATVWGLTGAAGSIAAALAQPQIGYLIDRTGSCEPVFLVVASLHIVSAACISWLVPRIEPLPPLPAPRQPES